MYDVFEVRLSQISKRKTWCNSQWYIKWSFIICSTVWSRVILELFDESRLQIPGQIEFVSLIIKFQVNLINWMKWNVPTSKSGLFWYLWSAMNCIFFHNWILIFDKLYRRSSKRKCWFPAFLSIRTRIHFFIYADGIDITSVITEVLLRKRLL